MSHNAWFNLKPALTESQVTLTTGITDPRDVARQLMDRGAVRGELTQIRDSTFRVIRPGAVHEVNYSRQTGVAMIRTTVAGFLVMLNRIHQKRESLCLKRLPVPFARRARLTAGERRTLRIRRKA